MFYDVFCELCEKNGLTPGGAAARIGFNRASVTVWKNTGRAPKQELLLKIADYFGVTTDFLLTGKETAPAQTDARELTFDDFTYAMQNESKELTEADRELLLSMARQLNQARKQKKDGAD